MWLQWRSTSMFLCFNAGQIFTMGGISEWLRERRRMACGSVIRNQTARRAPKWVLNSLGDPWSQSSMGLGGCRRSASVKCPCNRPGYIYLLSLFTLIQSSIYRTEPGNAFAWITLTTHADTNFFKVLQGSSNDLYHCYMDVCDDHLFLVNPDDREI